MTRYARAKGSKASNERLPNEATPWHVMKEQLETAKSREPEQRTKSARELLEKQEPFYVDTVGNLNNDWAEFEDAGPKKAKNKPPSPAKESKVRNETANLEKKKKKGRKAEGERKEVKSEEREEPVPNGTNTQTKKKKKVKTEDAGEQAKSEEHVEEKNKSDANGRLSKRQKRNQNRKRKTDDGPPSSEGNEGNAERNNDSYNRENGPGRRFNDGYPNNRDRFDQKNTVRKRKPPKVRDDLEHKRRKPDQGPVKMTINGVDIEVVKYDGFPVKKEDAERLKELRQKMIMKGIPKPEINAAMKLERRKAEKALARLRKCVCFHCRKSGHNLSDCPELGSVQAATGICFKCGSTEHTHFECKVSKPGEYRFASCFICREQGHIAKQCPDNPKGVYPQGGSCKVCGDVTHLKKDCPDLIREREENAILVDTIADGNLEALGKEDVKTERGEAKPSSRQKVVKF